MDSKIETFGSFGPTPNSVIKKFCFGCKNLDEIIVTCPICAHAYCQNCSSQPKLLKQCSTCNKMFCKTCFKDCTSCKKEMCMNCTKECSFCHFKICCNACQNKKCNKCGTSICKKCSVPCKLCSTCLCKQHLVGCSKCGEYYCDFCCKKRQDNKLWCLQCDPSVDNVVTSANAILLTANVSNGRAECIQCNQTICLNQPGYKVIDDTLYVCSNCCKPSSPQTEMEGYHQCERCDKYVHRTMGYFLGGDFVCNGCKFVKIDTKEPTEKFSRCISCDSIIDSHYGTFTDGNFTCTTCNSWVDLYKSHHVSSVKPTWVCEWCHKNDGTFTDGKFTCTTCNILDDLYGSHGVSSVKPTWVCDWCHKNDGTFGKVLINGKSCCTSCYTTGKYLYTALDNEDIPPNCTKLICNKCNSSTKIGDAKEFYICDACKIKELNKQTKMCPLCRKDNCECKTIVNDKELVIKILSNVIKNSQNCTTNNNSIKICSYCNKNNCETNTVVNGKFLCNDCISINTSICTSCNKRYLLKYISIVDNKCLCELCKTSGVYVKSQNKKHCMSCDEEFEDIKMYGIDGGIYVCENCYLNNQVKTEITNETCMTCSKQCSAINSIKCLMCSKYSCKQCLRAYTCERCQGEYEESNKIVCCHNCFSNHGNSADQNIDKTKKYCIRCKNISMI